MEIISVIIFHKTEWQKVPRMWSQDKPEVPHGVRMTRLPGTAGPRYNPYWCLLLHFETSLVALMVKNLPAVSKTCLQSLGRKDSLEKGMATLSSILVWRIRGQRSPAGCHKSPSRSPWGCKKSDTTEQLTHIHTHTHTHTHTHCTSSFTASY